MRQPVKQIAYCANLAKTEFPYRI